MTLVDTGGGIDASTGQYRAPPTLTGSTNSATPLLTDASNAIGTLNGFPTNTSGDFSLTDNAALTITGHAECNRPHGDAQRHEWWH